MWCSSSSFPFLRLYAFLYILWRVSFYSVLLFSWFYHPVHFACQADTNATDLSINAEYVLEGPLLCFRKLIPIFTCYSLYLLHPFLILCEIISSVPGLFYLIISPRHMLISEPMLSVKTILIYFINSHVGKMQSSFQSIKNVWYIT